jgi:hypothetical protein
MTPMAAAPPGTGGAHGGTANHHVVHWLRNMRAKQIAQTLVHRGRAIGRYWDVAGCEAQEGKKHGGAEKRETQNTCHANPIASLT